MLGRRRGDPVRLHLYPNTRSVSVGTLPHLQYHLQVNLINFTHNILDFLATNEKKSRSFTLIAWFKLKSSLHFYSSYRSQMKPSGTPLKAQKEQVLQIVKNSISI